jgi:hypothetical protein
MPTRCAVCRSETLYHGKMGPYGGEVTPSSFRFTTGVQTRCAVCLSCGSVQLYLQEDELEKVKTWAEKQ